jgi:hypothetical protein
MYTPLTGECYRIIGAGCWTGSSMTYRPTCVVAELPSGVQRAPGSCRNSPDRSTDQSAGRRGAGRRSRPPVIPFSRRARRGRGPAIRAHTRTRPMNDCDGADSRDPQGMTSTRANAYRRVVDTLRRSDVGVLSPAEQACVREAADCLLFSTESRDADAVRGLAAASVLVHRLIEAGRWPPLLALQLVDDLFACGPGRAASSPLAA